jgi:hypothetical protein
MNNPRRIQRHLVKALAAGALLAAAALPMAIATVAGAVTPPVPTLTSVTFTPHGATGNTIAEGATGTVAITGANFADNGGTVTLTQTSGVVFSAITETSSSTATANYDATAGTPGANYSLTLADFDGTSNTLTDAFNVTATPTISAIAPSPIYEGTGANTVTITGSGFETGATVTFTADAGQGAPGTHLTDSVTSVSADGTTIVVSVTPTNPANSTAASLGTFDVTVANPDGGSVTDTAGFTVTNGIQEVSPSAVPGSVAASNYTAVLSGSGFEANSAANAITVTGTDCSTGVVQISNVTEGAVTNNTAAFSFTETGTLAAECVVTIHNPATGGNGLTYVSAAGALAIGEASTVAPLVTGATAPTTPIAVGSASTTTPVTLTGAGFSQYSQLTSSAAHIEFNATTASTGTTITAPVEVLTGAAAGPTDVEVYNTSTANESAPLADGFNVAGPAVTSSSPAAVAVGAPYGTVITLTGTGFNSTTTGTVSGTGAGSTAAGIVAYTSATTMTVTLTSGPIASDVAGGLNVNLTQSSASGNVVSTFNIPVDAAPTVTNVTYPAGAPAEVGVGATAQTVYINGSGFETGATVTAFVNASGTADPNVTATVTKVTAGQLTVTIAVKGPDTNASVGYKVTNTDGGVASVTANSAGAIVLGAGPTITSITPATGTAGATTSFAVVGTNFEVGAVVTLSPANGTCGTATVSSLTTLAVTCTLGEPSSVATDLVVTNPDGGSAIGATPVLPAATAKPAPKFHVSGVHGAAVAGKTVTITISGTGFYGQPKITSTAVGSKFKVSKDNGRLLTVRATVKAGTKPGEHVLTVKLANGKSGKAGFNIKA